MPLGNVFGEFTVKITSLKQTELDGGGIRVEMDTIGEATGQLPGTNMGTLVADVTLGKPSPFKVTGMVLPTSGAPTRYTGWGVGVGGEESHKVRLRGAVRYMGDDPNTDTMIGAVEAELDLKAMTVTGALCEWT